jgi:hypothetical protein
MMNVNECVGMIRGGGIRAKPRKAMEIIYVNNDLKPYFMDCHQPLCFDIKYMFCI